MSSAFSFGKLAAKILSLPDVKPYSVKKISLS